MNNKTKLTNDRLKELINKIELRSVRQTRGKKENVTVLSNIYLNWKLIVCSYWN